MNNGDIIRTMSNKELAASLANFLVNRTGMVFESESMKESVRDSKYKEFLIYLNTKV